ncbi:MAG: hypothetical protein H6830_11630 [Planctomycetes bacterium]|nr:hypothetical protein [Planctomycetota bacterium]MCB9908826.1 hypothetical protein [Planctomycetota bacterium]MCB9912349.1 hypothetical protein [Planctomycetota bacterium]
MNRSKHLFLPGLALALMGGAFAQGDDCSTAATLTGLGTFSYDTTGFSTSGYNGGGSCVTGNLYFDGFFQWTAPAAGDYVFDTVGTAYDTKLAVHTGSGCAATCADYNDDTYGLQSEVNIYGALAGDQILIQVAGYSGTTGFGPGTLNIATYISPCAGLPDDAFEDNDTCGTATVLTAGSYTGLHVDAADSDYYSVTIPPMSVMTWTLVADSNNTDFNIKDATCSTTYGTSGGSFTYTTTAAAETIIVQAVNYAGATLPCSDYDIDIAIAADPCQAVPDDIYEENDDCASAAPIGDGTIAGLYITYLDQKDIFSTCVADGATITVDILFTDALQDIDLFLRDASSVECGTGYGTNMLAYGYSVTDNETATWTNTTGADVNITIEVDVYLQGTAACSNYDLVVAGSGGCGGGSVGTVFCDPMNPNSTGASTHLSGNFGTGVGSDLHLEATSGPPTQFGYFLIGTAPSDPGIVVSQGRLCLSVSGGNVFGRYNVPGGSLNSVGLFDAGGVLQNLVSTSTVGSGFDVPSTVPISGSPTITAGSTWHFQLWHRENAGASNFSNGLSVTF